MNPADENPRHDSRPTGIGPGERLQAARIQMGMSVEDVAARMHLSVAILESIEDNNFEEITAPIFVKGYLRAYARMVSLDEDEMILQYIDFYSEEDPPISSTSNMAPELSVADARIKWTTYLVILVLGVLLAAWWWNKEQADDEAISLDATAPVIEQDQVGNAEIAGSEIEAVSENPRPAESSEAESDAPVTTAEPIAAEPELVLESESVPGPEPEPEVVEVSPVVAEPAPTVAEVDVVAADAAATDPIDTEPVAGTRNLPVRLAPAGSDRMRLIVHADTWADIKDSSDFQLVYDLLRADQTVELVGEAPFSVFLGNGHGIEILLNDEAIDLAPRVRDDNTARLKIGG